MSEARQAKRLRQREARRDRKAASSGTSPGAPMFFHGSVDGLNPGRVLRPRSETGAKALDSDSMLDRVHVTTNPWGAFYYAWQRSGAVYEVRPLGTLERDPHAPTVSWVCPSAQVIGEFMRPTRRQRQALDALADVTRGRLGGSDDVAARIDATTGLPKELLADVPAPYRVFFEDRFRALFENDYVMVEDGIRPYAECSGAAGCGAWLLPDPQGDERCVVCGLRPRDGARAPSPQMRVAANSECVRNLEELVQTVCDASPGASSPLHGEDHWLHVAYAGALLLRAGTGADPTIVFLFALLHDSQRSNEGRDPDHGRRAARFVDHLADESQVRLEPDALELLKAALVLHDAGMVSDNRTVGTCWDADRLNLPRIGITLDPALLSTPGARDLVPQADRIIGADCQWGSVIHHYEAISGDRNTNGGCGEGEASVHAARLPDARAGTGLT